MDYLQYEKMEDLLKDVTKVLNLIINGLPSILCLNLRERRR